MIYYFEGRIYDTEGNLPSSESYVIDISSYYLSKHLRKLFEGFLKLMKSEIEIIIWNPRVTLNIPVA